MKVTKLLRVARNVADLEQAAGFYQDVLGFERVSLALEDAALAQVLGVAQVRVLRLRLGAQEIELSQCFPAGSPYPKAARANAGCFQHIAIIATDIATAVARVRRAGGAAISRGGPVRLPQSSGGVIAYKFRDLDGHPLEFLQFPDGAGKPEVGFDHSGISVADVDASVAFYAGIGVLLAASQINQGPAQDAVDGLDDVAVDVVALNPSQQTPHVELLGYRTPKAAAVGYGLADLCADRLVFQTADQGLRLLRDPDGHVVLLDGR
jgi:catechol 2,3-dioxygenase-like lactoylglutathione lyase family enzyme